MKKIFPLLILFMGTWATAGAQTDEPTYKARYRYNLDNQLHNRKLIYHLDTLLPYVFTELRQARSCGRFCNPDYTLEVVHGGATQVEMNPLAQAPSAMPNSMPMNFNVVFHVRSWILLKNTAGDVVKYYQLTDSADVFSINKTIDYREFANPRDLSSFVRQPIINNNDNNSPEVPVAQAPPFISSDVNYQSAMQNLAQKKPAKLYPTEADIAAIIKGALLNLYADNTASADK
jgi:hypothetical protein